VRIIRYLMNNFRLIKIGATQAQRKLFFNLRRQQTRLEANGFSPEPMLLARHLGVKEYTVAEMEHLSVPELSVYAPVYEVDKPTTLLDRVAAKHATPEREVTEHEYRIG
jgi:RNA polymerase sigma-32 factor